MYKLLSFLTFLLLSFQLVAQTSTDSLQAADFTHKICGCLSTTAQLWSQVDTIAYADNPSLYDSFEKATEEADRCMQPLLSYEISDAASDLMSAFLSKKCPLVVDYMNSINSTDTTADLTAHRLKELDTVSTLSAKPLIERQFVSTEFSTEKALAVLYDGKYERGIIPAKFFKNKELSDIEVLNCLATETGFATVVHQFPIFENGKKKMLLLTGYTDAPVTNNEQYYSLSATLFRQDDKEWKAEWLANDFVAVTNHQKAPVMPTLQNIGEGKTVWTFYSYDDEYQQCDYFLSYTIHHNQWISLENIGIPNASNCVFGDGYKENLSVEFIPNPAKAFYDAKVYFKGISYDAKGEAKPIDEIVEYIFNPNTQEYAPK
jgi:hypothetical protein